MLSDLRHAVRMLLKSPAFAVLAVLTLAVGIGANTAIFTVVNGVLLKPLPYAEPDRIVGLWEQTTRGPRVRVSTPNFRDWRARATSFEAIAAFGGGRAAVLGGAEPVFADVYFVSDGFFRVFGVPPAFGRTFTREELAVGGVPAVVVGDAFWRQTLGANRDLSSLQVRVEGMSCRVVGVMPPGFAYPADADVWIPKELFEDTTGRTGHNNSVVARLAPGVGIRQADAEMDAIAAQIVTEQQRNTDAQSVTMVPLLEALTGGSRDSLLLLLAAVGLVLLIACVNVASTLLARGEERRRELAVRAALGAARSRLVRQLLTENLVLSVLGAIGGVLISGWLVRMLLFVNPTAFPRPEAITVDPAVLLFAGALACLTPLVFGLVPSLQVSRTDLRDALAEGGRSVQAPFRRWVRNTLIGVEVAVTLLLLVGSVLLIRSFRNVLATDAGFDATGVITAEMSVPGTSYPTAAESSGFFRDLLPQVRSIPGVRAAGAINDFPLSGSDASGLFAFDGDPDPFATQSSAGYRIVTPGYFEAMGIPVRSGRTITDEDVAGREAVAVVNEDFVTKFIPDGRAIGRRFRFLGMDRVNPTLTIVGVVHGVKHASLVRSPLPEVYASWLQLPSRTRTMTIAVKPQTAEMAAAVVSALRERVRQADPDVPVEFSTLSERIGTSVSDRRFTMIVLGSFAAIALLLAAVGIYGVLAYSVAQRAQEIGIRMALGAEPASVVRLMLRSAFGPVAIGVGAGLVAAMLTTRVLQASLYGVGAVDPIAFAAAALLLTIVAAVASYIPARRATAVDPMKVIRA